MQFFIAEKGSVLLCFKAIFEVEAGQNRMISWSNPVGSSFGHLPWSLSSSVWILRKGEQAGIWMGCTNHLFNVFPHDECDALLILFVYIDAAFILPFNQEPAWN